MTRVYNFAAGPAMLPQAVLEHARDELLEYGSSGMSVMEVNHRGKNFAEVAEHSRDRLRSLMAIPDNYRILFLHGPARIHFAAVPLNLAGDGPAEYVDTGLWSKMAIEEAERLVEVNVVASSREGNYTHIPPLGEWRLAERCSYLHYTPNETIGGVEFHAVPEVDDRVLVADMSSNILSRPIDVGRFGIIYAGAQKNMGIAGLAVVIVREDLLGRARPDIPSMLDYQVHAEADSLACTAPTFAWYLASLVLDWIDAQGGLEAIAVVNKRKAEKLYACIDSSNFYHNPVAADCRSWMNVPFTLPSEGLDEIFLRESAEQGLVGLKGHRFVGGMRASIYNAMPEEGVDRLIEFMGDFMQRHA
ncbi:MAG: 3-phosphoserine/phosphohydroxythreonine transaminase [Gammaproteobacteria bacterium]|nr:3-phosphoserine/phosphohydroxythreonine transaminase [Gammaproteobacteria bacterium]NIM73501.1 3-phosphoserine/phosphohydroxythreonine transaminase [Gammaproteobacteria bacterium]NIN39910.1 3-phosphoserine/phosphohydroxythreonine transaminase [Gammaproteobacteria bacterium]NIO25310.1 3-phosphoserine/phosphohydroxythreonine transaminase [Gammaproteobacteria bacterium]NIO65937.1 3-phosphoserine/phosphohydroxythreonine transaminase [Gammaproteobacteria bacterium]